MHDAADMELLRDYARQNSEAAFAELVRRHINLVYSAALRHVGIAAQAEEITQAVFIILARKAGQLREGLVLEAWLFETTRLTALSFLRGERRRQFREQEAYMQSTLQESTSDPSWQQFSPLLDEAMMRLGHHEREAVVLRFFKDQSMGEVAAALNIREPAAQMRVGRALDKLRRYFLKRGVSSTTAIIAGMVAANSVHAAPAGLANTISAAALAKGAAASASTLTLVKGALKIMAWTKAKTAIVIGVGVLLAIGATTVVVKNVAPLDGDIWQKKYDPNVLDRLPPEVKILPSLPPTLQSGTDVWGVHNNRAATGLGLSASGLLMMAYGVQPDQIIPDAPLPEGKYDFIANLPTWDGNLNAMQNEIQKSFGLTIRRETIETNVLILTVQSRKAPGLHRAASSSHFSSDEGPDSYSAHNESIQGLISYLEQNLGAVIVDQTRLEGNLDIDFKWDKTPDGLKQALLDQLGLQLIPSRKAVEFVVVEKAQ